jgi:hypothetical protein
MPTAGKSLVGFMSEEAGIKYLREVCHVAGDNSDARLSHEWRSARSKLGGPMDRVGTPEIKKIPDSHRSYIAALCEQDWLKEELNETLSGATFQLVEIDPLLAMQFAVDTERSSYLTNLLPPSPSLDALLKTCLPSQKPAERIDFLRSNHKHSMLVVSRNLSLKVRREGAMPTETTAGTRLHVGIELIFPVPLVHVVRFNDRCYLHNGFHRAYGARLAGATHIPCIFREVNTPADVGIAKNETFDLEALQSTNPPTLGHYTQGRAYDVQLKSLRKVLQVSWSEYMLDGD